MIDLYTAATPNGWKASIMLEETGLPYRLHLIKLAENEQKTPDFLSINPNGRIPAIVDHDAGVDGGLAVFETGAILLHLAEKAGRFLPADPAARSRAIQWLMWQMGGLGPMMGQLNVFRNYFPEKLPAAIDRYDREVKRLFGVMDARLAEVPYLAGDDYSIADIAAYPWVHGHDWSGVELAPFPALSAWLARVGGRPAVARGMALPPRQTEAEKQAAMENARKILV